MADRTSLTRRWSIFLADELAPSALAADVFSGLLIYALEVLFVISFAALVFAGPLANQLPRALGLIVLGDAVLLVVIALLSSYPGSMGVAQDTPGAIVGVAAAAIAANASLGTEQQFGTVLMMVVLTTVLTGACFILLGIFKLGGLVRFLPYPVMGGFLAGTGWLLAKGGIGIMAEVPMGLDWLSAPVLLHWLPGAILGVIAFGSITFFHRSYLLLPLLALGGILFYGAAALMNVPVARLDADGWLVGSIPAGSLSHWPLSAPVLSQVDWTVLIGQIPNLTPALVISVVGLLLNSGGLELVIKKDIDLNRELVAAGIANVVAGPLGGLVGYPAISLSTLNVQMSGGKRLVGLLTALLIGATVLFGASFLAYIPKVLLGAVLVYLGVSLLVEWIFQAWFRFPRLDFAVIVVILGIIIFSGFLNGILVGLLMAIALFVVSYSRTSLVKSAVTGREHRSRVTHSRTEEQLLETHGDELYLLELQGYIFFGAANRIFDQVRQHIQATPGVRFVLLDFGRVSGLDSTGLLSFARMLQWLQGQQIILGLSCPGGRLREQFVRGGWRERPGSLHFFADSDHAVEWWENQILAGAPEKAAAPADLAAQLRAIVGAQANVEKIVPYLCREEFGAGEYLMRQGDEPDKIYFVESGRVTVQSEIPGRPHIRRDKIGPGHMVGELAFYLGIRRTAAVVVDEPSVIYSLSMQTLADIEKADPAAAAAFHRINVLLLSERAVKIIRALDALEP